MEWRLKLAFIYFFRLFIYLAASGLICNMQDLVPDQGLNPGPLHWELRVSATGPPGKSLKLTFKCQKKKKVT